MRETLLAANTTSRSRGGRIVNVGTRLVLEERRVAEVELEASEGVVIQERARIDVVNHGNVTGVNAEDAATTVFVARTGRGWRSSA